jgi:hypothetical protein
VPRTTGGERQWRLPIHIVGSQYSTNSRVPPGQPHNISADVKPDSILYLNRADWFSVTVISGSGIRFETITYEDAQVNVGTNRVHHPPFDGIQVADDTVQLVKFYPADWRLEVSR